MKLYKITDENGKTRAGFQNECQWGENVTHRAVGGGKELCSDGFIHAYTHPLLAVLFNPIGGNYNEETMLIWEAKGRVVAREVDKVGCKTLTTIKQIKRPIITTEERCIIAIKLALRVCKDKGFRKWARAWLMDEDRTASAAEAAEAAAKELEAAAWAAAWAAEGAAAEAAKAAAKAATKVATEGINVLTVIKEIYSRGK